MRPRLRLLAAAISVSGFFCTLPARAELLIEIDKTAQRMSVSRDGASLHVWPVSTGRSGHDTPSGRYTPFRLEKDHFSREWDDAPMPNSVFFTKQGHAIHGSFDVKKLGSAASAGCVRLEPKNAEVLFNMVKAEGLNNVRVAIGGQVQPRRAPSDEIARRGPLNIDPQEPGQQYQYRDRDQRYVDPRYGRSGASQGYVYGQPDARYQPRYAEPGYAQQPRSYYYDQYGQPRYYQPPPNYDRRGYRYNWD